VFVFVKIKERGLYMARRISESGGGGIGRKSAVKSEKPKKLSKYGEWIRANPDGIGVTYVDMRAVMN